MSRNRDLAQLPAVVSCTEREHCVGQRNTSRAQSQRCERTHESTIDSVSTLWQAFYGPRLSYAPRGTTGKNKPRKERQQSGGRTGQLTAHRTCDIRSSATAASQRSTQRMRGALLWARVARPAVVAEIASSSVAMHPPAGGTLSCGGNMCACVRRVSGEGNVFCQCAQAPVMMCEGEAYE